MFRKIIISTILFGAMACTKNESDPADASANYILQKEVYGVYVEDNNVFVYDSDIYQYAYNTQRRTFRIQNTAQSRYLACELDADPVPDEVINVRVETMGISSFPTQELRMQVLKRADGLVWLWNNEDQTGFVIRIE